MGTKYNLGCLIIFSFVLAYYEVISSEVPTVVWNIKGNSLHIKPVSAFENKRTWEDNLKTILEEDSSVLVYAVNTLSMEDFYPEGKSTPKNSTLQSLTSFLDFHPHMFLPSVREPLNHIHNSHCGVEEVVIDHNVDENVWKSVSLALDRSCVVILHLPDEMASIRKEQIKDVFKPAFDQIDKNIVGVFTAVKSSWDSSSDQHKFRNLLSIEDNDPNFINYTGCILMYTENITLKMEDGNKTSHIEFGKYEGSCSNDTAMLNLTATAEKDMTVVLMLTFSQKGGSWQASEKRLQITGGKDPNQEFRLGGDNPEAPLGFSYSCGDITWNALNVNDTVTITLARFQIQPFNVQQKFSESFDCVPFFTIPIWMGIFVGLLLITILNSGIYALFSVHTMDRFDDPKGKTITVPASLD